VVQSGCAARWTHRNTAASRAVRRAHLIFGIPRGRWHLDACEKFLVRQKPWVRTILRGDPITSEVGWALTEPGAFETLGQARDAYEELLAGCPKHLSEYRKLTGESAKQLAVSHLPPAKRGRHSSQKVGDLGQKAARLRKRGSSFGAIAQKLCEHKIEPGHRCNKACADRIRQRALPYLSAK
jgi:hypothetical protein